MAPTAIKSAKEVTLHKSEVTLHTPDPGAFHLETVARAGRALRLIEQILQRNKAERSILQEEAPQGTEKSEAS